MTTTQHETDEAVLSVLNLMVQRLADALGDGFFGEALEAKDLDGMVLGGDGVVLDSLRVGLRRLGEGSDRLRELLTALDQANESISEFIELVDADMVPLDDLGDTAEVSEDRGEASGDAGDVCDPVGVHDGSPSSVVSTPEGKGSVGSASDDPAETRTTGPFRTLTDHLEDLVRVDEILTREFPRTPSRERIRVAIEITGALKWGAL